MFFLGASANILVYLLVSAFFVVCLYFNGEPVDREVIPTFGSIITYVPTSYSLNEQETYVFQCTAPIEQAEIINKPDYTLCLRCFLTFNSSFYSSPELIGSSLRAPPILFV